jgi:hypothetical protein
MDFFRYIAGVGLTVCFMGFAIAQDFPQHPANKKDAESQGLVRVGIKELKAFMPGTIKLQSHKGKEKLKTFRPDGRVEIDNFLEKDSSWKFDENQNGYCNTIPKRSGKLSTHCFATFKASDNVHYFDYDEDGLYAGVWRPESKADGSQ